MTFGVQVPWVKDNEGFVKSLSLPLPPSVCVCIKTEYIWGTWMCKQGRTQVLLFFHGLCGEE